MHVVLPAHTSPWPRAAAQNQLRTHRTRRGCVGAVPGARVPTPVPRPGLGSTPPVRRGAAVPPRRQRSGHRSRLNKSARRPPVRLGSRVPSGAFDGDAAVRVRSRGVSSQQWCRVVVRSWLVVVPSAPSPPSRPVAAPGPAPGATCTSPRPWRPLCALRRSPSAARGGDSRYGYYHVK